MNQLIRGAIGNIKHEGMYLTLEEMELLAAYCEGQISEEEYDRRALLLVLGVKAKQYLKG
ncbi:hypothetical protein H1164_17105 [Thermoactinomyces daqus]|uniref:Uncharacterized protein n=1 Tax=Thermoactinomyces daqus TaxID=1329516 RepID=A0A7W1XD88_9BACL|nr:hypothetical protein [Thermoactinomyces daqus]MBA4544550.1 hypothetical protein [Thermoactinomyces daqus]